MDANDFLIHDEDELRAFLWKYAGIRFPDVQVCEHHTTPWRAFADAYFAKHPVCVWLGSRGFAGKSFELAALTWVEAVTLKADANVLGASGEQSARVLEYLQDRWDYVDAPKHLLVGDTARKTELTWGNKIVALMASMASVRGPHPQRLRLDEVDEMKLAILDAALGQPMMGDTGIKTQIVMSSTRQYSGGTMDKMLERAARKGWGVYEWCYRENLEPHGWLSAEEVEEKKSVISEAMWEAEYENQDPNPGARAIQTEKIELMFNKELGEVAGNENVYYEFEEPVPDGVYATGTDWAKELDWTIIWTLRVDVNPARFVAFERTGRLDWSVMVSKHDARVIRYPKKGAHDATGVGNVINDYLTVPSEPFVFAGRARAQMLSRYITAIEHGEVESPMIDFAYSEHKFASNDAIYSSREHLPDSIAAGALAWHVYKKAGVVKKPKKPNKNQSASAAF